MLIEFGLFSPAFVAAIHHQIAFYSAVLEQDDSLLEKGNQEYTEYAYHSLQLSVVGHRHYLRCRPASEIERQQDGANNLLTLARAGHT